MGVVIVVFAVALAFLIGFCCGYEECYRNEIIPAHESNFEQKKEGDVI